MLRLHGIERVANRREGIAKFMAQHGQERVPTLELFGLAGQQVPGPTYGCEKLTSQSTSE